MSGPQSELVPETPLATLQRRKARVAEARRHVSEMFDAGTPGLDMAIAFCAEVDEILLEIIRSALNSLPSDADRAAVADRLVIVAVGGTGRGELCPYSDIDLLFLDKGTGEPVQRFTSLVVQACWDAKLELGHSIRNAQECITLACHEPQVATSLVEARLLWGHQKLFDCFFDQFTKRVVVRRRRSFLQDCLKARLDEGPQAQELEPDVKNSIGGLRDLHLIRWLGFAIAGAKSLEDLMGYGLVSQEEVRQLRAAREFLTRLRIDLHLRAGRAQDRLTRDEQLRIAEARGITGSHEQRPVERLMQEYFRNAHLVANIARRLAERHRPRPLVRTVRNLVIGHRADGVLRVSPEEIDARTRHLPGLTANLESILRMYKAAALYGVPLSPRISDAIKAAVPNLSREVSEAAARLFLDILHCTGKLGAVLRSMADTEVLDVVIPDFTHIRCLMQFNQYHHYTVDEHTLRAMEVVTSFEQQDTPVGAAYHALKNKELLHLALLLHDIGKGFVEDHCVVGERIAHRIGARLFLSTEQTEQIAFLVRYHLDMSDIALRRDLSDESLLVKFSRLVGSPERLRMLYTLTAADVTAVGPDVWTGWKADLMAELFDRTMLILSGKRFSFREHERLQEIKQQVAATILPLDPTLDEEAWRQWIAQQLAGFSAYYLTCTPPARIAADLDVIQRLSPDDIEVTGIPNATDGVTEYRVITRHPPAVEGCFHRICGVLAAKRLEILSADINTTGDGVVVDTFRVLDTDFSGPPPASRIDDVTRLLVKVLRREESVESLLKRNRQFGSDHSLPAASNLPTRVAIDNESSDTRTIIDVFAHDQPGLLYRIARTLHELQLSVDLAKIATHFDQVVDVFYVTEADGRKLSEESRLEQVRETLLQTLTPHARTASTS